MHFGLARTVQGVGQMGGVDCPSVHSHCDYSFYFLLSLNSTAKYSLGMMLLVLIDVIDDRIVDRQKLIDPVRV